ncbi:MAG TPA: hypothetical protein VFW11_20180 [Cyclobacteriaceae bacterium]|nr:hypothetical protein [Cyclobacteriaceae bacterium]
MNELEKSLKQAMSDLDKIEVSPFSQKGFERFTAKVSEYIFSLYQESHRTSRESHSELISKEHVDLASSKMMRVKSSKWTKITNTIAGLLLGAAISNVFSMASSGDSLSVPVMVLTVVSGIIGAFLLGFNLMDDL